MFDLKKDAAVSAVFVPTSLGCFADDPMSPDLSDFEFISQCNSPSNCSALCFSVGRPYIGMQARLAKSNKK